MRNFNFKKITLSLVLGGALIFLGWLLFAFNFLGIQDYYYGSRYFRPYAELKQEQLRNQIVLLKDNRILLFGWKQSEIFDPKTKTSELVPGIDSIHGAWDYVNLTVLKDGNILITPGAYSSKYSELLPCYGLCPDDQVPIFDVKLKKFYWVPSAFLRHVTGHTITVLPSGKILIIGGEIGAIKNSLNNWRKKPYIPGVAPVKLYSQNDIIIFDPKNYELKILGHLQVHRTNHQTVLVDEYKALVFGGSDEQKKQFYNSIELVDLKSGESKIIGRLKNGSTYQLEVFPLGQDRFLIAQDSLFHGRVTSEVFDLKHPEKTHIFSGAASHKYLGDLGTCTALPGSRFICVGSKAVRDIVPIQKQNRHIDQVATDALSDATPIYIPEVGLLVFGSSRNLFREERTVQLFNDARYIKDYK